MNSKKNSKSSSQRNLPPISLGITVIEDLPFPVVHYPPHYGSFIAFSADYHSKPLLCACSHPAVENYLRLQNDSFNTSSLSSPLKFYLGEEQFPTIIYKFLREFSSINDGLDSLFAPNLCHRCNMKTPSVRWCHEMYGVSFVQFFGWYIYQTYYRFGLLPGDSPFAYLEDVCPEEIQLTVRKAYLADSQYQIIERLIKEENPKDSITSLSDELLTVYQNFINGDVEKYNKLVRTTRHLKRKISAMMENFTRSEFGFKKIGEGWVNETLLYNIIKSIFPGQTVIRHFRPDWLERLELDIYLPDLKIALEYQGQQHFTAVEAWGGEKALVEVQERDRRKARLCKNNNIRLILIDFTEPLTENYIKQVLFQRET